MFARKENRVMKRDEKKHFTKRSVDIVFGRMRVHPDYNKKEYRIDDYGNLVKRSDYGKRRSRFGFEIDHKHPSSRQGSDLLSNLRGLHWAANVRKGNRLYKKYDERLK